MDDLIKFCTRVADFWGWITGAIAGIVAAVATWRRHGGRVCRTIAMSDNLHAHFGPKAGKKMVEEFSRRSKDILLGEVRQQFLESKLGVALYVCSSDGSCEYSNESLADLFGLERAEMLGNGWMRAINRSERQKVIEFWEYAIKHRIPYDYEYNVVHQGTLEKFRAATRAFPVVARDGEILFYVGIVEKILDGGK